MAAANNAAATANIEEVDVVIIGGGGCGLTLSSILSNYGVKHVLFEQRPTTSQLPKAHYLNQRTMEIFRQHDMGEEVTKQGGDGSIMRRVLWKSSLGKVGDAEPRLLASVKAFPGGNPENKDAPSGPTSSRNFPQIRLEPILKNLAESRNSSGINFSHTVTSLTVADDGGHVQVKYPDGTESTIRAKYVIGADGGRFVAATIGTEMEGVRNLFRVVTVHFKADLSAVWDEDSFLTNLHGPHGDAGILPMGPTWGKHSEEWIVHLSHGPQEDPDVSEPVVNKTVAGILQIPESAMKILKITKWSPECVLASAYRKGPVFLAGDAAHRHPPTSGLGLNTAVADAHNLGWKLALVLKHGIDDKILDTYEQERHPAGRRNCDWSLMALSNRRVLAAAIGIAAGLNQTFKDPRSIDSTGALLQEVLATQKVEFSAQDLEIGHVYESATVIPDGTVKPKPDPHGQIYVPSTRPGHRLPHAWLRPTDSQETDLISTHDLTGKSLTFVLITDPSGQPWIDAVNELPQHLRSLVRWAVIAPRGDDSVGKADFFIDEHDKWAGLSELKSGGAILVRPDNYVAWRSTEPGAAAGLVSALEQLLPGSRQRFDSGNTSAAL